MDEEKKKKIMIGLIVGCLVLAGIVTFLTNSGGGSKARADFQMLCVNPDCDQAYTMPREEFMSQMSETGISMNMGAPGDMGQVPALTCPECSENSGYMAIKCQECERVFIEDHREAGKCPECGYSRFEAMRNR